MFAQSYILLNLIPQFAFAKVLQNLFAETSVLSGGIKMMKAEMDR